LARTADRIDQLTTPKVAWNAEVVLAHGSDRALEDY